MKTNTNKWSRIESLEIDPQIQDQLIQRNQEIQQKKKTLLNKQCRKNCVSTSKRVKLDPVLHHIQYTNSKLIKDLTVRPPTIKLLREKVL
jgi:hypothetical protein